MTHMEPITRKEMFMAKAGGQDINTPTPITREEMFLSQIGGSGGGNGGEFLIEIHGALVDGNAVGTCKRTFEECYNAIKNGERVWVQFVAPTLGVNFGTYHAQAWDNPDASLMSIDALNVLFDGAQAAMSYKFYNGGRSAVFSISYSGEFTPIVEGTMVWGATE